MRDGFIFYASFLNAIEGLDDSTRLKAYDMIAQYALREIEPENVSAIEKAIFELIKPQILATQERYEKAKKCAEYGKLGGAPKGNQNAKKQPSQNSKTTPPCFETTLKDKDKLKENVKEKEKEKSESAQNPDLFFDKSVNQIFSFYKQICTNLAPIIFEERNLDRRQEIKDFLFLVNNDLTYVQELFGRANKQISFYDNKINLKSLIKNHESIYQGIGAPKTKEGSAQKFDENIKKLEAKFRAQEVLNDTR